jgi:RimJ/RimL family protein N-acetyltransferase
MAHTCTNRGAAVGCDCVAVAQRKVGAILLWEAPDILTDRLKLRHYRPSDLKSLSRMAAAPEMFRYSERGPMTREEAWGRLLRHVGHWQIMRYGIFAVEDRSTGRYVGETGVADFRRNLGSDFDRFPESTWSIVPEAQGQGFASEAALAALRWLERGWPGAETVCLIHIENLSSLRVAEKLGYRQVGEVDYRGYRAFKLKRAPSPPEVR